MPSFLDKAYPVQGGTPAPSTPTPASASLPKPVSFASKTHFVTPPADQPTEQPQGDSFLKSLVSAPATILARPVQAIAELAGASPDSVDAVTKKLTGGLVAPVPRNFGDVKKDVGRGAETVAFGLGPVAGGALFGAGNSVEQGNDIFSAQTALQTALGAGAGKVLDLVGKPLLDAAGKVVGKVTPEVITDIASKGTKAIQDFAASHNILPEGVSSAINTGAKKLESLAEKPFDVAGSVIKKPFVKTPENIVAGREKELAQIENNYVNTRKANEFSKDSGSASRKRVANTDVLVGSVDENGLIRTKQPGGAIDQYKSQTVDGAEGVVRKNLERLGETVNLKDVEKSLMGKVKASSLEGADLTKAINGVKKEVAGYALKANKAGDVPLTLLHDAKVNHYNNINYQTPPEIGTYRKSIANGLKTLIEDNSSFNVKEVNGEIGKYLEDVKLLERLDGKRVRGGKLGKYFAQISGNIIGGAAGAAIGGIPGSAAGTVIGGELANRIKGTALERSLGGKAGFVAPKNAIIEDAIAKGKLPPIKNLPVNHLPSDFVNPKDLPVIDFGKPKPKVKSKLPTIR